METDMKKGFTKDWRSAFFNEPLPDLKCLNSGDTWQNLTKDEVELVTKQKEAQKALDQIVFCVKWVRQKKEDLEGLMADDKGVDYANLIQNPSAKSDNNYYNVQTKKTPNLINIGRSQTDPVLSVQKRAQTKDTSSRAPATAPRPGVKTRNSLQVALSVDSPVSDEQISDDNLRILSTKISDSFLLFGSQTLGFTQNELEMCQSMSDEKSKQALRMLLKWKRRLGHRGTTANLLSLLQGSDYDYSVWGFLKGGDEMSSSMNELPDKDKDFEPYQTCVIKDYTPASSDEISLRKGDFIKIQDKGRTGWYYGCVRGERGWLPKYCVGEEESTGRLQFRFRVQTSTECSLRSRVGNLECKKGENLDVIEETSILSKPCYRVRNKDGLVGVVSTENCRKVLPANPILWEREWFHQGLSRREAENKLKPSSQGAFLIRDASKVPGNFVLSVRTEDDVANFMVTCHSYGYTVCNNEFSSLQEIIDYFKKNVIRDGLFLKSSV